MQINEIRDMIEDRGAYLESRRELVNQLGRHSKFLFEHRDDLSTLWENRPDLPVLSFYETLPTPSVQKVIPVSEVFVFNPKLTFIV